MIPSHFGFEKKGERQQRFLGIFGNVPGTPESRARERAGLSPVAAPAPRRPLFSELREPSIVDRNAARDRFQATYKDPLIPQPASPSAGSVDAEIRRELKSTIGTYLDRAGPQGKNLKARLDAGASPAELSGLIKNLTATHQGAENLGRFSVWQGIVDQDAGGVSQRIMDVGPPGTVRSGEKEVRQELKDAAGTYFDKAGPQGQALKKQINTGAPLADISNTLNQLTATHQNKKNLNKFAELKGIVDRPLGAPTLPTPETAEKMPALALGAPAPGAPALGAPGEDELPPELGGIETPGGGPPPSPGRPRVGRQRKGTRASTILTGPGGLLGDLPLSRPRVIGNGLGAPPERSPRIMARQAGAAAVSGRY